MKVPDFKTHEKILIQGKTAALEIELKKNTTKSLQSVYRLERGKIHVKVDKGFQKWLWRVTGGWKDPENFRISDQNLHQSSHQISYGIFLVAMTVTYVHVFFQGKPVAHVYCSDLKKVEQAESYFKTNGTFVNEPA